MRLVYLDLIVVGNSFPNFFKLSVYLWPIFYGLFNSWDILLFYLVSGKRELGREYFHLTLMDGEHVLQNIKDIFRQIVSENS